MGETSVVTCFLRNRSDVLLRRSEDVGSYPGQWSGVAGHVAIEDGRDRSPEAVAHAEICEETGIGPEQVTLVRAGDPFVVTKERLGTRWRVHPFLFDSDTCAVEGNLETAEYEWVSPTAILERDTVPALWTSYDRVRPRVATVREDRDHGSAWLSVRALEVLRDEGTIAAVGRDAHEAEQREVSNGDDWDTLAGLARELLTARPLMSVVTNRINRAMATASEARTVAAIERVTHEGIDRAITADSEAATTAAEHLPARVGTLSRSGTVRQAIEECDPSAVLVAESRPGREGVGMAEQLAATSDVTLTTDAAFPAELDAWDADALVVGADRVLPDGRVVNKVGTRGVALASETPCYVVTASDKIATDDAVDREARDPSEVYDGDDDLSVSNPTFDVTPADAIEAIVTERGILTDDRLAAVVTEHRTLAEWE